MKNKIKQQSRGREIMKLNYLPVWEKLWIFSNKKKNLIGSKAKVQS